MTPVDAPIPPRWRSLRWRLPLLMAAPAAALALVGVLGLHVESGQRLRRSLERRGEVVARLVQDAAESAATPAGLQRFVGRVGADPDVRVVVVAAGVPARVVASSRLDWVGQPLAALPPEVAGEELRDALDRGGVHRTFHEARQRFDYGIALPRPLPSLGAVDARRAAVVLQLDTRALQAELLDSTRRGIGYTLLAALAVTALGYLALKRMVTRPLAALGEAVRRKCDHEDPAWAATDTGDELGALARTMRDSIRRRAQSEASQRLTERLASVGSLAGGVAHEINTPLQFVNDSVHFLRDATHDLLDAATAARQEANVARAATPEVMREALRRIAAELDATDLDYLAQRMPEALTRSEEGVSRVRSIVHSLQACADGSSHALQHEDLNRTVKNAVTVVERTCLPVTLVGVDFGALPSVVCHAGDIYDAVLQLLHNAIEAVARRHGRAAPGTLPAGRVSVRTTREHDEAIVEVSDNGDGIAADIAAHVFDPFFTTKGVGHGRGQGLAVAWRAVTETHGGRLTFARRDDGGTTFTIRLPIDGPAVLRSDAA